MSLDHELSGAFRFELPANADIRVGPEIQAQCRAALDAEGDVELGCDAVERIDAAVMQCIGALGNGLRQADRHLELVDPSPAFSRAVELLGFGSLLGIRTDVAG